MTSRERILAALKGEKADVTPWIPLCYRDFFLSLPEYGKRFPLRQNSSAVPEELMEAELEFRIRFYRNIGADFMSWSAHCPGCYKASVANLEGETVEENGLVVVKHKTPVGVLEEKFEFSTESQTLQRREWPVKTDQDYSILKYIIEHTRIEPSYAQASKFIDVIGDSGIAIATGVKTPLSMLINGYAGAENLLVDLYEKSALRDEVLGLQHRVQLEIARVLAGAPYRIFLGWSSVDIGVISPAIYGQYYAPYFKQYNEILRRNGKVCADHLSGQKIGPFVEVLEQADFDGFYGIAVPPRDGDIKLSELAKRWKEKGITPMAGPNPHFLATAAPTAIADVIKRALDEAGDNPFILGTGDDVVPGTPIKNLEIVSETIRKM